MKKLLLCILCIFCTMPLHTDVQEEKPRHVHELRGYGLVGLTASPAIAADLGLGFRFQYGYVGLDVVYDTAALFAMTHVWRWPDRSYNTNQRYKQPYPNRPRPEKSPIFFSLDSFKITPSILIYPRPNLASEWYVGIGVEIGNVVHLFDSTCVRDTKFHFFAPECIVGKKYINSAGKKRFFELRVSVPTFFSDCGGSFFHRSDDCHTIYSPIFTLKYGFMF